MISALRMTIMSRRYCEARSSAMVSRNSLSRTRGPPLAVAILYRGPAPPPSRPAGFGGTSWITGPDRRSGGRLVQSVIRMERPHRKLGIFVVDQHRGLDFRGGDELDVDALVG